PAADIELPGEDLCEPDVRIFEAGAFEIDPTSDPAPVVQHVQRVIVAVGEDQRHGKPGERFAQEVNCPAEALNLQPRPTALHYHLQLAGECDAGQVNRAPAQGLRQRME